MSASDTHTLLTLMQQYNWGGYSTIAYIGRVDYNSQGKEDTMIANRRIFLSQSLAGVGLLAGANRLVGKAFDPSIIGAAGILGYGLYQAIELIRELGFQTIEIHPMGVPEPTPRRTPGFQFDRISGDERRKIKSALTSFRHVSTHLPFKDLHYFSPFVPIAEFSVKQIDIALEASAYIGAEIAVIHPQPASGLTLQQYWTRMLRHFRRWGDIAEKAGIRLALETGYPNSVDDYVRLIKEIGHEHVGATIDVGHQDRYVELQRKVKPEERGTPEGIKAYNDLTHEIIDQLGTKVFHFHVHDIEPDTWREHKPLHYGFVDYPRLIKKLRKIGYRGLLVFEISGPASEMGKYLADGKRKLEKYLSES